MKVSLFLVIMCYFIKMRIGEKRMNEQYLVKVGSTLHTRPTFEQFLELILNMRKETPFGFDLKFLHQFKDKLIPIKLSFGCSDQEVRGLMNEWNENATTYPFFNSLVDIFALLNKENEPCGEIIFKNSKVSNLMKIRDYFYSSFHFEGLRDSGNYNTELFSLVKSCYFELRTFIALSMTPSNANPFVSEFEVMQNDKKFELQNLLNKTKNTLERMQKEDNSKKLKYKKGSMETYLQLKKIFDLLNV